MTFVRHLERLAAGHIPANFTEEVDRAVRRVVKANKKLNRRTTHDARPVMAPNKRTDGLESTSIAHMKSQRNPMGVDIGDNVRHNSSASPVETTASLANRLNDEKRPCHSSELREPIPVTAFCVDTSRETFCSFLDLIKSVRVKQSTVNYVIGGKYAAAQPVDASPPKGKRPHLRKNVSDDVGPERSPCSKSPLNVYAQTERLIEHPTGQQSADPGRSKSIVMVSKIATMEVLRCTLKLLAVNLFYLVRDTAIRRARRENEVDFRRVTPTISRKGNHTPGSKELLTESRDEREPIEEQISVAEREKTNKLAEGNINCAKNPDPKNDVESDNKGAMEKTSVVQGADTKRSRFQSKGPHESWTENMHGVIQELGHTLRDIMEEDIPRKYEEASHQSARVSSLFK